MPPVGANSSLVALLGRRDQPTDALRDYCRCLADALERRGTGMEFGEVSWEIQGFAASLLDLWRKSKRWRGRWVLVQYTALSWSRRGLPVIFLLLLCLLRLRRTQIAVVFHDPGAYLGSRFVDRLRRLCQRCVMRRAYGIINTSILTVPLEQVSWIPRKPSRAAFIPVGSNVPPSVRSVGNGDAENTETKTIAVFSMTDGAFAPEIDDITFVVKSVSERILRLRLVTLGRGSKMAEATLRHQLSGHGVEFAALGILPPENISKTLSDSDVLLFARGSLSTQRGSAIAAIACGLPIVAYSQITQGPPLSEAGVLFVPEGDRVELSRAVTQVLMDIQLWQELHRRSLRAYEKYFSWDAIADKFIRITSHD